MRRAFLAVVGISVVALAVAALTRETSLAFTLGVVSAGPVAPLENGDVICQGTIDVPRGGAFDTVRFKVGTYGRSEGPPLEVTVRSAGGGDVVASGRLAGGYPDVAEQPYQDVRVGEVPEGAAVTVCIENRGERRAAIYGNAPVASRGTTARTESGRDLPADLELVFVRSEPASLAGLLDDMFFRASLFRPSWAGPWAFWALAVLLVAGVPALLVRAMRGLPGD